MRTLLRTSFARMPMAALYLFLGLMGGCHKKQIQTEASRADRSQHFSIRDFRTFKVVAVKAFGKTTRYILARDLSAVPDSLSAYQKIRIPLRRFVALSTTHLGYFEALDARAHLVGFPNPAWIYDKALRARAARGVLRDLGSPQSPDVEALIALHPDVIFSFSTPGSERWKRLVEKLGIPVLTVDDYRETAPLTRSSWIYFFAAFFDKTRRADSLFRRIKTHYQALCEKAFPLREKPQVLSGILYGSLWYLPGGHSYSGRLIADAGGLNPWAEDTLHRVVKKSFEAVYRSAASADFWINVSDFEDHRQLLALNSHYRLFKAYRQGALYAPTRAKRGRSNDYFESGALRCDWILEDLYHIFSHSSAPLHYYQKLK